MEIESVLASISEGVCEGGDWKVDVVDVLRSGLWSGYDDGLFYVA